jgi:hypothetical protein
MTENSPRLDPSFWTDQLFEDDPDDSGMNTAADVALSNDNSNGMMDMYMNGDAMKNSSQGSVTQDFQDFGWRAT